MNTTPDPYFTALTAFLSDAGFTIEDQFGNWDRQPLTDASPEILTIAAASAA